MSRIGKKEITLPEGIDVNILNHSVEIQGPKGLLTTKIRPEIIILKNGNILNVNCITNSKTINAYRGLTRALLANLIHGVSIGFEKRLTIEGVGYKVALDNDVLTLNIGFSEPTIFKLPNGINAKIEKNEIILKSIDKEKLGQTAAQIRALKKPEPYKGKGIRYTNEHIVKKAGKAAGKK